jgi:hypothetical protein
MIASRTAEDGAPKRGLGPPGDALRVSGTRLGDVERADGCPIEVLFVWALFLLDAVAICVTYSRVPPVELYHVSHAGLAGGASRVLVFSNFPLALVSIAILGVLPYRGGRDPLWRLAVVAGALCCAVFWPGIVDQADLDARPVNAIAAVGVLLASVVTIAFAWRGVQLRGWHRSDTGRIAVAVPLVLLSSPWIAAELGFFLDGVPGLGSIFQTGKHIANVHDLPAFPPAVHHGHHHGLDGLLLALTALILSRALAGVRRGTARNVATAYLALMFCYGIGNIANDGWLEQVVKRGWTKWEIPSVLEPRLTVAWGIIAASGALLYLFTRARDT